MNDPNLKQLIVAARALKPLLNELVFVGGCVTGLLIRDEVAADPRGTMDLNAIATITSYAQFGEICARVASPKIGARTRRYAAGYMDGPSSISCRWKSISWGSRTVDTEPQWNLQSPENSRPVSKSA